MSPTVTIPRVSAESFESLARLQQLTLETGLSDNRGQLVFRVLNRSIMYCRYDRAVLWDLTHTTAKLLGVSGNAEVNRQSPLVCEWRSLVQVMSNRDAPGIIDAEAFPGQQATWKVVAERTRGLSVAWLPIKVDDRTMAGLWLERWGEDRFTENELARLEALALAYGVAWRGVVRRPARLVSGLLSRKRAMALLAAALAIASLSLVKVPLRIVAPCEAVPKDPVAVNAPLKGVIDQILVLPGRSVHKDDLLALYDKQVVTEETKIAREQVQIIESELQRSRVQAFDDPSARSTIALLKNRLEQEKSRLQIALHRLDLLEIRARISGTLMFNDPHEWRGRPVQVGQQLMMIVDPNRTKLRIWLPEGDNISFDDQRPLKVILDSDPRSSRSARLCFLANQSQVGHGGMTCFKAEADWIDADPKMKTGLQGTAILYGEKTPLAYWLLRHPFAAVRRYLGI